VSAQPDGTAPQPPSGGGSQSLQATLSKMGEQSRERSPFMFLVIGLCFFLPFISLSCSGRTLGTLSGVQLVTGAEMDIDEEALEEDLAEEFGLPAPTEGGEQAPTQENDPSIWAILALAAAVIGVLVGFVTKARTRSVASFIAALLGLTGLLALRFDIEGDLSEAEGLVSIDYKLGYWISALLFVILALSHGTVLRANRVNGPPSTGPPGPAP
jgi:hypothetical protein